MKKLGLSPESVLVVFVTSCLSLQLWTLNPMVVAGEVTTESGLLLKEGLITVQNSWETAKLKKLWYYQKDNVSLADFLQQRFKKAQVLWIEIPQISHSLLLLDGQVKPLIYDGRQNQLWHIDGLEKAFESTSRISVGEARIKLSQVRGDADILRAWTLDFSDHHRGLKIIYQELSEW